MEIGQIEDEEHKAFLQLNEGRVELLQMDFEKFMSLMETRFFPPPPPVWRAKRGPQSLMVYVAHCRQPDAAKTLLQQLRPTGCALIHSTIALIAILLQNATRSTSKTATGW